MGLLQKLRDDLQDDDEGGLDAQSQGAGDALLLQRSIFLIVVTFAALSFVLRFVRCCCCCCCCALLDQNCTLRICTRWSMLSN